MSDFECNDPNVQRSDTQVPTLHAGQEPDACDQTDYSESTNDNTAINVLELYRSASPSVGTFRGETPVEGGALVSTGSAFFAKDPTLPECTIVTANHLVSEHLFRNSVVMPDGQELTAFPMAQNAEKDIALLKVLGVENPAQCGGLPLAQTGLGMNEGQGVAVVAPPAGTEVDFVSPGTVHKYATNSELTINDEAPLADDQLDPQHTMIRSKMNTIGGQSGGPLLDGQGSVRGVQIGSDLYEHSLATPVDDVRALSQQIDPVWFEDDGGN